MFETTWLLLDVFVNFQLWMIIGVLMVHLTCFGTGASFTITQILLMAALWPASVTFFLMLKLQARLRAKTPTDPNSKLN